jgi:hypothetical protein
MKRAITQQAIGRRSGRRGVLSMELVLTLPILCLLLLAMFYSRSLIVEASRVGARKASLPGVTETDVEDEIRRVLVPRLQQGLHVDVDFGEKSGDVVTVSVAVPMTAASPDLLWPIGFSLKGQNLFSETRMVRE